MKELEREKENHKAEGMEEKREGLSIKWASMVQTGPVMGLDPNQ